VRRRLGLSLLAFGAGVCLLVSAAFAGPNVASRRYDTLRLMWGTEPDSLDPALAAGTRGSLELLFLTCSKLFNTLPDPKTGRTRITREVVRSYTVSNGGRTYTFELRRTFRFSNRAFVTARSFADAFDRDAVPRLNSLVSRRGFLDEIVGAKAAMAGKSARISGVQVLGRYRLRIRLTRPAQDLIARLTMPSFCPILPGTPTDPEGIDEPPGSGPYYVAKYERERRIVLERNPYYTGNRIANPNRILWTIDTDPAERIRATERGENDFTVLFGQPDAVVRDLADRYGVNRPGGQFLRLQGLGNFLFAFNTRSRAFEGLGQAPLRKAINYALDRPALVRMHGYLAARKTDRLLPAALSNSRRLYPIDGPDPLTARKWRDKAKYRPQTLTLYTANFPFNIAVARLFATNLKQLDIEVVVKTFDFVTLAEKLNTSGEPWDVTWLPWGSFYADPAGSILPLLRGTRYEARIDAVNRMTGQARAKAWAELETALMRDDPPVAVYADSNAVLLLSRSLGCFNPLPLYALDLGATCRK
jgi:ABC-type oligopeptide transport system substrate-binding subunit